MKVLLFLVLSINLFSQDIYVKSLRVFGSNSEISFPIVEYSQQGNSSITIDFDLKSDSSPNLNIRFLFCNSEWKPYNNQFLSSSPNDIDYNLWLERVPRPASGADYHFRKNYPNKDIKFPFSGNWIFQIYNSFEPNYILGEGRFFVVRNEIQLNTSIKEGRIEGRNVQQANLGRIIDIEASFNLVENMFGNELGKVVLIENQKINSPNEIKKDQLNKNDFYEWNGDKKFKFFFKSIQPGNEYRQTNLNDITWYNPPETKAHYDGADLSRFFKFGQKDFNGGSHLKNYKDDYAEYMDVKFELNPNDYDKNKNIYLVGSFTNWEIYEDFKMNEDRTGYFSLFVNLKRGIYDYQYVTAYENGEEADWLELEGNFWETTNDYHIFVYYNSTDLGGFEKIIGYKLIQNR